MKKIKLLILLNLILINVCLVYADSSNSNPKNTKKNFDFVTNNLEINRKYKVKNNVKLFEKLIIGNWIDYLATEFISFNSRNVFIRKIYCAPGEKKICVKNKGIWKIENNSIVFRIPKTKFYHKVEVDYFILYEDNNSKLYKYSIMIFFKKNKLGIENLLIDFN